MNNDDYQLLCFIKKRVAENPDLLQAILEYSIEGIKERIKTEIEYGADMETLASVAVQMAGERRISVKAKAYFEGLAISKLEKHKDRLRTNWDWAIKK